MSASVRLAVSGVVFLVLTIVSAQQVWALGFESFGPAGEHISHATDWPKDIEGILRHPARVYWNSVNGNDHSYYDGDIKTVNKLLELFAQIDLTAHRVVIRPGRPSARSFHDKLTPYTVEFELSGGIYLHHVQQYATTGLYSGTPRLFVHVDDAMAEHLDELNIPDNVFLQASPHRVKDALAQIDSPERSLRFRAISVLGELGDGSQAVIAALEGTAADDDEHIRNASQRALAGIEQANDPSARALQQKVTAFVDNHPQRLRIPEPAELLAAMREMDERYARGFTAKGTMIQSAFSGTPQLVAWTVTMGDNRLVIQQLAVEDDEHPPTAGRHEVTTFVSPEQMARIYRTRYWLEGKLIEMKPDTTFEPVGPNYDLLIGRVIWPLGRDFSRQIDRITQITVGADGTLAVGAQGDKDNLKYRWELRIDPGADFLVRHAEAFRRDDTEPSYIVDNAGVLAIADRSTAHTGRWTEGAAARPVSFSVTSVSAKADTELIQQTEARLKE